MAAAMNTPPNEITYLFEPINTAQWYDLVRICAFALMLLISALYLYYSFKAKKMESSSSEHHKKED